MATEYSLRFSGKVTPIEVVTLADGTDIKRAIHSDIDRSIGGSIEVSLGSTLNVVDSTGVQVVDSSSANVTVGARYSARYKDYTTTTSGVDLASPSIFNLTTEDVDFVQVVIREAASTGTPDVQITLDGTNYRISFSGVKNFASIPTNALSGRNIKIKSSGATTTAKVDIVAGLLQ